jgi:hypothetical protein
MSDFDQRHNLILLSTWEVAPDLPAVRWRRLLAGWRVSQLLALRSGFPFSVHAPYEALPGAPFAYNNRADRVGSRSPYIDRPADGGRMLLDAAAFRVPSPGRTGNSGRNAFLGPGLFNLDLALGRTVALGEKVRITLRAEAFNALNHANLNNPDAYLTSPSFGLATFGRTGRSSSFPALVPLNETPRQIQLLLKVEF